jgi:AbrB family looped-hinge helix DNA binding protein
LSVLSRKRQLTIPKVLCDRLDVQPGDHVDVLEFGGRITILKRRKGGSAGIARHLRADSRVSDRQSLETAVEERRRMKRRAAP